MVLCGVCITNESLQHCTFSFGLKHSKKLHNNFYSKTDYIYVVLFISELIAVKTDHVFVVGNYNRNFV